MKRLPLLLSLIVFCTGTNGQINKFGTPLMKSYGMQTTQGAEYNWCITKDKFGVVYIGNDDNMVIRYDGSKWSTVPIKRKDATIVRAIGADDNGILYLAGPNEFGYIEPDSSGTRRYVTLTDLLPEAANITSSAVSDSVWALRKGSSEFSIGEILSLVIKDSKVYFLSARSLIIYDSGNGSLSYVNLRELGYRQFVRIFLINNRIFLADNNAGIFEFREGKLIQPPGGDFFKIKMCLSILPFKENSVLVGTIGDGVYVYNYETGAIDSSFVQRKVFNKLKELQIYCGARLLTGEIIYGTLTDGVVVLDENGEMTGHWNNGNTDMQDNVVTALYANPDINSELWILTAGTVTKAYVNLPFTQLSEKSGLDGSINSFIKFNGSLYVATDKGLYKSATNDDGSREFRLFSQDITSQVFPLFVASFPRDSFLLAGSTIGGVYKIQNNGQMSVIKGNLITNADEIYRNTFVARSILQSKMNRNRFYFGKAEQGLRVLDYQNGKWKFIADIRLPVGITPHLFELKNGDLVFITNYPDGVYKLSYNDTIPVKYTSSKGLPELSLNSASLNNGEIYVSSSNGVFRLNQDTDTWVATEQGSGGYSKGKNIDNYYIDFEDDLWLSTIEDRYQEIMFSHEKDSLVMYRGGPLALLPNIQFLYTSSIEGRVWMEKSKSLYIIDKEKLRLKEQPAQTLLTKIVIRYHSTDSLVMNETFFRTDEKGRRYPESSNSGQKPPEFTYRYNSPSFYWTTPYMVQEEEILYSYKLEGYDDEWSSWDKISYKDFTNLSFGKYTLEVKARTATEIESIPAKFSFIILKPWYLTTWMIIIYVIAAIFLVFGIIMAYTKKLKNENIRLEGIVAERTAVVVKQKEELESSIHYASRIQMALLPSQAILSENIKNYFVLFKPRDIVSGDFYWMTKKGERLYIVAADCTGHGVPGAFMSLLGMSFLDEIIDKEMAPRADFILNQLRLHVTDSLKQVGGDDEAKDGMDMALLVIDFNTHKIEFSGAYNPCFRVRKLADDEVNKYQDESAEMPDGSMSNGKYLLETIYASKMPIGISSRMNEDFVFYDWKLERGVSYYLFSDGYIDQFGGEHGRKFMKKNFKKLILEIQDYPMARQKELLEKNLKDWMGQSPQIDDILVMGIRTE